jgi:hypothetical protein
VVGGGLVVVVVGGLVGVVVGGGGGLVGGVVVGTGATGIWVPDECEPCVVVVVDDFGAGAAGVAGAALALTTWTAVPLARTVNHMLRKPWPMAAVRFLSPEKK